MSVRRLNERGGYCHCGCGQKAPIAPQTRANRGWTAGQPVRYLPGHHLRRYQQPGERNPQWRGGRFTHSDGYVRLYTESGYVLHARARSLKACGDPDAIPCALCGGYENQGDMYFAPDRRYGRHRSCFREYERAKTKAAHPMGDG
jgi:hypothetical protein